MSSRTSNPRASETKFIPIKTFKHFSHLRVKPKTGRTHQIRVHLSEFGHSIVGDPLYGKGLTPKREEQLDPIICSYLKETPFPYLHARGLSFLHPDTQTQVSFQAPLPQPFQELLKLLNENDEV
jgi:23S rRNA pseudouridine1911/1915/1917 synthase